MSTLQHPLTSTETATWEYVPGIQQVVLVGRRAERAVAIIELRPGAGFRLTTVGGRHVGDFPTLDEAELALPAFSF